MSKSEENKTNVDLWWRLFDRSKTEVTAPDPPDILMELRHRNTELRTAGNPPERYWNTFMPVLRQRIERRQQRHQWIQTRLRLAMPLTALGLLFVMFTHEIFITAPKIDYLVDQSDWIRTLNPNDAVQLGGLADRSFDDLMDDYVFQNFITVDEVNVNVGFDELGYDLSNLSADEQVQILKTLEQSPVF